MSANLCPRQALLDAKDRNDLKIKDIAAITGREVKTVENWLYEMHRKPPWEALYCVYEALVLIDGAIPRDLKRIVEAPLKPGKAWVKQRKA